MDILILSVVFLAILTVLLFIGVSYYKKSNNAIEKLKSEINESENLKLKYENDLNAKVKSFDEQKENFNNRIEELKEIHKSQLESRESDFHKQKEEFKNFYEKREADLISSYDKRIQEIKSSYEQQIESQLKNFEDLQKKLKSEFSNLANDILDKKTEKFSQEGKRDISEILKPFKDQLKSFEERVEKNYSDGSKERFSLQNEIKGLMEANQKLNEEAKKLTEALKGDSKTQGDWGEMILENILEASGLREGYEYFKQENIKSETGQNLRPDFIVKYPGEKYLVIDSKVSLTHYERYISSDDPNEKEENLKLHLRSVKNHIKELEEKRYEKHIEGNTPEFVMMFIPIEASYLLAMQNDNSLWNDAYKKRIMLISPTNLITSLKMISTLWEHDTQNKNVKAIADESGKLYDKFKGFVDDLEKIDSYLQKASNSYSEAHKKLTSGKGNLVRRAEKIRKLGATTTKKLAEKYTQQQIELKDSDDEQI